MEFKELDYDNWRRKAQFEFFTQKCPSFITLTKNLDCTSFYKSVKKHGLRIYPCFIYVLSKAVNAFKEYKLCYSSDKLGYTDTLHPSYIHLYPNEDLCTNIASIFNEDFQTFYNTVVSDLEKYKDFRGFEYFDKGLCFHEKLFGVTTLPLCDFTAFSAQENNLDYKTNFAPFFCIGKITKKFFTRTFPLSIRCNHASADGYHLSLLFNKVQEELNNFPKMLRGLK